MIHEYLSECVNIQCEISVEVMHK